MAIFSKSPAKQLADAAAARDKLAERLRDAEIAVVDLRREAERLAILGAADDQLDTAEARTRAMVDRVTTLSSALAQSKATVADLERERDEAADRKQREATSTETEALARRMTEGCAKLVADAAALADWTARAAAVVPEANGILHFCVVVGNEIPQASTLISQLLRVHAQAVLDGRAAAAMPVPPPAYTAPTAVPVALMQVFTLHAIRFVDHEGTVRQVGKWRDIEMVPALAQKAIRLKLAAPLTDPRHKTHLGQSPGHPEPNWLNDIDNETGPDIEPRLADPIMQSSPFETPTIGPARVLKIATRSSDPNEVR